MTLRNVKGLLGNLSQLERIISEIEKNRQKGASERSTSEQSAPLNRSHELQ